MTKATLISTLALCVALTSSTLWVYDPTSWRHTADAMLNVGSVSSIDSQTLAQCKSECTRVSYTCLSFQWNGDIDSTTSKSSCKLYKTRFGFAKGGINPDDAENFGAGDIAMLEARDRSNYFEKPMDLSDTIGDHLVANALRLNDKDYAEYLGQYYDNDNNDFNYDQFLLYYRGGIPGYVNNTDTESKYSVIMEIDDVADAEECAMYCTRDRGLIDPILGTRCISFNYNTDKRCHLLSFSMDGVSYNIEDMPSTNAEDVSSGWFYYESLQGEGCWVIQGQCRKWDDETYRNQQESNGKQYTPGIHVGVIREYATDPVCSKCFNTDDFTTEFEYICLDKARTYHEDYCDNDVDKATTAFWGQDGAGVAEIWNSWDLTTGCVIDLSSFDCIPDQTKYSYTIISPNPRFEGKKFRDSIGEEEYNAGVDKRRCFARAASWYEYCELGSQVGDNGEQPYLNVTFATDGSFYMEPPIDCECDEYGMKIEKKFGLVREYCTRDETKQFCYRENQEDYWSKIDLLCDDVAEGFECETGGATYGATGCYLYYPQPSNAFRTPLSYRCAKGSGRYNFEDDDFTTVNDIMYHEITCDEQNLVDDCEFSAELCYDLALEIHEKCNNGLETESEQIIVWYRPSGEIMVFPDYAAPYETTVIRGIAPATFYTEDPNTTLIDMFPIRNGRWQTFSPTRSGHLRQLDIYYQNDLEAELTCTIWYGSGITESIFLNQVTIEADVQEEVGWFRFPLDNITVSTDVVYTWHITATSSGSTELGYLGYVRGNGYSRGVGDLAWDYLFVAWTEGEVTSNPDVFALSIGTSPERPWFEIWCFMIMILFVLFAVMLCILHWRRKIDEAKERKDDREFQADIRERAMLQAERERLAREEHQRDVEEEDDGDYEDEASRDSDAQSGDTQSQSSDTKGDDIKEEFDDAELVKKQQQSNLLTPGNDEYNRVKSYSKNEMPGYDESGDGYQDKKKKKKKKRKKKKHDGDQYDEY